jgi:23S rRNA U2552 (ribose-2'-O)-methylase RlmE/FtsJ
LARIRELGPYVAVLSDAAPSYSGQSSLDHIRLIALAQRASKMADELLVKGGNFVAKISRGGEEKRFVESLAPKYEKVKFFKPQSSRQDSSEIYCVACNKR